MYFQFHFLKEFQFHAFYLDLFNMYYNTAYVKVDKNNYFLLKTIIIY
jgi:hypothetical protein